MKNMVVAIVAIVAIAGIAITTEKITEAAFMVFRMEAASVFILSVFDRVL